MKSILLTVLTPFLLAVFASVAAQETTTVPPELTTPDTVTTAIGELKFKDGVPDAATRDMLYDELDRHHAMQAFFNGLPAVSLWALREGYHKAGINDGDVINLTP